MHKSCMAECQCVSDGSIVFGATQLVCLLSFGRSDLVLLLLVPNGRFYIVVVVILLEITRSSRADGELNWTQHLERNKVFCILTV